MALITVIEERLTEADVRKHLREIHGGRHRETLKWNREAIGVADQRAGGVWQRCRLGQDAWLHRLRLPRHDKNVHDFLAQSGATPATAARKFAAAPMAAVTSCQRKVDAVQKEQINHAVILSAVSMAGWDCYDGYDLPPGELHVIDGFHRLLAWAIEAAVHGGEHEVEAFVAGRLQKFSALQSLTSH